MMRTPGLRGAREFALFAGVALLALLWGSVVAVAGLNAVFLCASLIGCALILNDFRIGAVLLIALLPISRSYVFPHEMLGIKGLNPFNLLLAATLGSYLLHGLLDGSIRRFVPRPLLWLYIVPIVIAGALGSRHVGEIMPGFFMYELLDFHEASGYIREFVAKPLSMVVSGLLVAAAVSKSEKPERFLIPMLLSIWAMGSIVIGYFYLQGVALAEIASSASREFLSPLGMHANELGRLYAVAYALLLFTWAECKEPRFRVLLLASMGVVVMALILTFSRGAFGGFIVVNVLFLLWRRNARTMLFLAVAGTAAVFLLPYAVQDRITTGFGSGLNAISAGRIEGLWLPLLPEIWRSPIYGSGLGSMMWSEAMRLGGGTYVLPVTHPHNAYLEVLLDMGMAGLILIAAYFIHVWKGFRALSVGCFLSPALRGFYLGALAGLASFLIAGVADSSLRPKTEQAFLWVAIGMMYGQRQKLVH